jgi:hypothetical protein
MLARYVFSFSEGWTGGCEVCVWIGLTWFAQVFKQEEFEGMFIEQVEKLKAGGEGARDGS